MERKGSLWKRRQNQEEEEEDSAVTILKDFCEDTSWGGLGRVAGSKYLFFRVIWLLAFLAAFSAGIYQLYWLFQLYESRPISTQISLERSTRLTFPTITICNFNMLRKSQLQKLPISVRDKVSKFATKRNTTKTSKIKAGINNVDDDLPDPSSINDEVIEYEKLITALSKESENTLTPLGHQLDNMVMHCEFRGVTCTNGSQSKSYWTSYWHYKFGNCFSFNQRLTSEGKANSPLRTTKQGPSHGLILEIDTEQTEYVDQLTENAGAVVHISPRGQMPFPFEEGLRVAPGYSTSIGLRMVDIIRVDRFNNNSCVTISSKDSYNLYTQKFQATYSTMACLESCMARHQSKDCGCMHYKYYPSDKKVCDEFDKNTTKCLRTLITKSRNNQLNCTAECLPPCEEQIYRMTSSFSVWPSENYMQSLNVKHDKSNKSSDSVRKNLLKLEIFFQDLNYERMQQEVSYKIENFVSDIGGQLGLWLGVSVLSGLEVIELICLIFIHFCYERPKNKNKSRGNLNQNGQNIHNGLQMT